jgi:hypothetical protein
VDQIKYPRAPRVLSTTCLPTRAAYGIRLIVDSYSTMLRLLRSMNLLKECITSCYRAKCPKTAQEDFLRRLISGGYLLNNTADSNVSVNRSVAAKCFLARIVSSLSLSLLPHPVIPWCGLPVTFRASIVPFRSACLSKSSGEKTLITIVQIANDNELKSSQRISP